MSMGMRSTLNDREVIEDSNGQVVGLSLGFDFTAEHEAGIDPMKRALGLDEGTGIEARTIKTYRDEQWLVDRDQGVMGFSVQGQESLKYQLDNLRDPYREEREYAEKEILTAMWGESGFLVTVCNDDPEVRSVFEQLVDSYEQQQLALALQPPTLTGGGLFLIRPDQLSEQDRRILKGIDHSQALLQKRSEETGVPDRLSESDRQAFALTPKWVQEHSGDVETDYSVLYWLNPREQDTYNSGWFTVEQLEQWLRHNEGPVVKENASVSG